MEVKTKKYTNLFEIYHRNSLNNPQTTYIEHHKFHYTYDECTTMITKVASYIQQKAKKNRPVVGLGFSDQFKFIISYWACAKIEADIILIQKPDALSRTSELEISNLHVDIILSDDDFEENHDGKINFKKISKVIDFHTNIKNAEWLGSMYFYTSGTTGKSKFVKTTYYQIVNAINCITAEKLMPYVKNQCVLITAPLFHSYGLSCLIEYTAGNSKIILPPLKEYINPIQCLFNTNISSQVTAIEGVPYFYQQMALFMKRMQLPRLQHIGMGGDAVSQKLLNQFHTKYDDLTFSIRYGITEIPSVVSIKYFKYSPDCKPQVLGKILSIYKVDIEKNNEYATTGELSIEHFYLPQQKIKIHTGDIFECIASRFSFISRNTFIKYKGYKINPIEIETYLSAHEAIDDCRVLLINSILTAEIVTSNEQINLGSIKEYLKEQLRDFLIPDRVEIVKSIKRTKTGKIIRH